MRQKLTTGMDVVDLSHRRIARIAASDGLKQECLHVLRVDANIGSRLIGPERGSCQVVVVDDPLHVKEFFHAETHAAGSREQIHCTQEDDGERIDWHIFS